MEFGVLGPVTVRDGERFCDLGTPKARSLLAVLLCSAGRYVSVSTLVHTMWPGGAPVSAVKNIQLYVWGLRRALGSPDLIQHHDGAYRVDVRDGELDADRFAVLARRGRSSEAGDPAGAADLYRLALAEWRGEPYAGLIDVPLLGADAARLWEARRVVCERRADVELRLGRHAELVGDLTALVRQYPLHDHLWAQLMTALYRCGRRADALRAYETVRTRLAATGLRPGPSLQQVQQAVLTADPALAA